MEVNIGVRLVGQVSQNDLILENIFQQMDWKTLCKCRQVSNHWYTTTLKFWRELAPPILINKGTTRSIRNIGQLVSSNDTDDKKYWWGGVSGLQNVVINSASINKKWIDRFPCLVARGTLIKKLHIDSTIFLNLDMYKHFIFCKYTPNLACLKLSKLKFDFGIAKNDANAKRGTIKQKENDAIETIASLVSFDLQFYTDRETSWPIPWIDVFSKYPNLKKLRLAGYSDKEFDSIFLAVNELWRSKKLYSLTSIDVGDRGTGTRLKFPVQLYESIRDMESYMPQLSTISVAVSRVDQSPQLEDLLVCVADKLKHLKLSGSFSGKNRSLKLHVTMSKLVSVTLQQFHLKSLNFLLKTPILEKLYIFEERRFIDSHNIIESTKTPETDEVSLPFMHTFACNQVVPYQDKDLRRLQGWMPNLLRLKLHLNDTSFFAVCKHFPKIKQLHICKSKVTDFGLSGYRLYDMFKESGDEGDYIITTYEDQEIYVLSDDEIPFPHDPEDSDVDDFTEQDSQDTTNNNSKSNHSKDISSSLSSPEPDEFEMDDDGSYINKENNSESKKFYWDIERIPKFRYPGFSSYADSDNDLSSCNSDCSEDSDTLRDRRWPFEIWYRKKIKIQDYELTPNQCPYNATRLKELEVLIIEICGSMYGRNGNVSTVPFRVTFPSLPNLREVWMEDGVATRSGRRYAIECGLFLKYEEANKFRPQFID